MRPGETSPRWLTPARLLTILLTAVVIVLVPLLYSALLSSVLDDLDRREWGGADFTAYYTAASLIRKGISPYDEAAFSEEAQSLGFRNDRPYIYPPLLAIGVTPLTILPPRQAATVWFLLNVTLLGLSALLVARTLGLQTHKIAVVSLLLAALTFYPAVFSIFVGQANVLLLSLLVLAWYGAERESDALVGVAIAAASLIKLFPFCLALYFLWKGLYRPFLITVAAIVVLTGFTIAVVGLEPHLTYMNSILPTQLVKPHPLNQSLSSFIFRAIQPEQQGDLLLWRLASLSTSALIVLGTVLLIKRGSHHAAVRNLEIGLVVVGVLLVSTVSWIGTLTLLIIPYAAIAKKLTLEVRRRDLMLVSVTASLSFVCVNSQRAVETYATIGGGVGNLPSALLNLPMYGMILLWFSIGYLLSRHMDGPLHPIRRS
jgi:hypothetical protein